MNKRKISIMIALLVVTSMILSACGATPTTAPAATAAPATAVPATSVPPTSAPVKPVTLTIWHNWGPDDTKGAPLQSVFKDFMAANPDITIKDEVYVDADIPLKVETASTSNQEPDLVFSVLFDGVINWADSGVALPVNDYIKQWGLDGKFSDVALGNFTQADGKILAFPLEGFTWPIWYNTKLFKQAGLDIPTTTDQLIADAKVFRDKGIGGPVIASGSDGMGGSLFNLIVESMMTNEETIQSFGKGDWTVPGAVKGVKLFTQLRDAGVFVDGVEGVDYPSGNTRFFSGTVPMAHFGSWSYTDPAVAQLAPDVKLGGFPLAPDSPWKRPVYFSGFTAKGIFITPNGGAKIDAVKRFIQYMYQPDTISRFVPAGMAPPLKSVNIDKSTLPPLVGAALDLPSTGDVPMILDTVIPAAVGTDMGRITQEAFAPGTSAEKILADLTAAYAAIK
jgi:multiple sugar transport system substrate-binding protein